MYLFSDAGLISSVDITSASAGVNDPSQPANFCLLSGVPDRFQFFTASVAGESVLFECRVLVFVQMYYRLDVMSLRKHIEGHNRLHGITTREQLLEVAGERRRITGYISYTRGLQR